MCMLDTRMEPGAEKLEALVMSAKKKSCFNKEDKHFFIWNDVDKSSRHNKSKKE